MASNLRNSVISWFKTKMKPTETQFTFTWDSIWFKDEKIPATSINNLQELLDEKADNELLNIHLSDTNIHITEAERKKWNSGGWAFNLSNIPVFVKYKYFGKKVFGILLEIPNKSNDTYFFNHDLNIDKYLRLEVWENGLPFDNPKMKAREDLTQLIDSKSIEGIGSDPISSTPIGGASSGDLQLSKNNIVLEGGYVFPQNKLIYIEFTKK